jgi:hypothetical protein
MENQLWEDIIRGKEMEAAGGGPMANDPRDNSGAEEARLNDIYRRVKAGEGITDAEGVDFLKRFNSPEDLRMLLEYMNRAIQEMGQENTMGPDTIGTGESNGIL